MKNLINKLAVFIVGALFIVGCDNLSKPKIKTSMGILTIDKVTYTVIDPFTTNTAPDGYQYLGIAIAFKGANANISPEEIENFKQASKDATVIGDDGSKPIEYINGLSSGQLFMSYLIKSTAKKFTLHWPNNSPIELIVSK